MPPSCLGVRDELHLGSVGTEIRVALKWSCSEHEKGLRMGSPWPSYGRVNGMYDYQGLAGGSRWGLLTGGQKHHKSNLE